MDENSLVRPRIAVVSTELPGCYELRPVVAKDTRGSFTKIFHRPLWQDLGLATSFAEEYVTYSRAGVIRGLHFQVPPMDHAKVVLCLQGRVLDVAVDLRRGSPAYGKHIAVNLNSKQTNALYLPAGVAHGFCVIDEDAVLYYKLTTVYSLEHDGGIRWDSAGIQWPVGAPLLSERDEHLPLLKDFESPFRF